MIRRHRDETCRTYLTLLYNPADGTTSCSGRIDSLWPTVLITHCPRCADLISQPRHHAIDTICNPRAIVAAVVPVLTAPARHLTVRRYVLKNLFPTVQRHIWRVYWHIVQHITDTVHYKPILSELGSSVDQFVMPCTTISAVCDITKALWAHMTRFCVMIQSCCIILLHSSWMDHI